MDSLPNCRNFCYYVAHIYHYFRYYVLLLYGRKSSHYFTWTVNKLNKILFYFRNKAHQKTWTTNFSLSLATYFFTMNFWLSEKNCLVAVNIYCNRALCTDILLDYIDIDYIVLIQHWCLANPQLEVSTEWNESLWGLSSGLET